MRIKCGWRCAENRLTKELPTTLRTPQIGRPSLPQRGLSNIQGASGRDGAIRGVPEEATPARQRHMRGILGEISVR